MHLNCALVSSFLFVSAVLAADSESGFGKWGGAFKSAAKEEFVTHAAGTFTVPHARGVAGSSFIVAVGIDGLGCQTAGLVAGIRAVITDWYGLDFVSYCQFWPHSPIFNEPPKGFIIHPGHRLKIAVNQTSSQSNGNVKIENLTTHQEWYIELANPRIFPLCQKNALWAVGMSEPESGIWPLTDFDTVVFTDLWYVLGHGDQQPRDDLRVVNIDEGRGNVTSVQLDSSFDVIIKYKRMG